MTEDEGASFNVLVALGPAEASRRLHAAGDWAAIDNFVTSLLGKCCPIWAVQSGVALPPQDINGDPLSVWMMWLATSPMGEEQPEDYIKRAQVGWRTPRQRPPPTPRVAT